MAAELSQFSLASSPWPKRPGASFVDFKTGRLTLSKHLGLSGIGVLSIDRKYAAQLLLKQKSELDSGRVPLFVCECCADLGCGALTAKIERVSGTVRWSEFGW